MVDFAEAAPALEFEGVTAVARDGASLVLTFDPTRTSAAALIARVSAERAVLDIRVERPAIEEVISHFYDLHGAVEA